MNRNGLFQDRVGSIWDRSRVNIKALEFVTQTARLILREKVDFARQQPDRNRQNRAATVDSCFVLIGTRQHGVAVLYETSDRASSNKMQQNPCPIKPRTLNLPAPRITRCHITCLREKADKASNSCLAKSTECRIWPFHVVVLQRKAKKCTKI